MIYNFFKNQEGPYMRKLNEQQLLKRLGQKGIGTNGRRDVFKNYSYYQLINAYKPIFIERSLTLGDIRTIIENSSHPDYHLVIKNFHISDRTIDKFGFILYRLSDKYKMGYTMKSLTTSADKDENKNKVIKKLEKNNYSMHVYFEGTHLNDFIQFFKFEHDLRNLLLKYTLIIEENIKSVFVNFLNDQPDIDSNFLLNAKNYNINGKSTQAIRSMSLAVESIHSDKILSLTRKNKQNIVPPYWMSIPTFVLNGVINTIDYLSPQYSYSIKSALFERMTGNKPSSVRRDHMSAEKKVEQEREAVNQIFGALTSIGEFRNSLAHNSPIFLYNIKDCDHIMGTIDYMGPKVNNNKSPEAHVTRKKNATGVIKNVSKYLHCRHPNLGDNRKASLDLSYNIFLITNIMKVIDKNSSIKSEIKDIYQRYNIFEVKSESTVALTKKNISEIISTVEKSLLVLSEVNIDELRMMIDEKKPVKQVIREKNKVINDSVKNIESAISDLSFVTEKATSKYPPFKRKDIYTKYTGVDKYFLINL